LLNQLPEDERDKFVAQEIKAGKCPFGNLKEGQSMGHCPLGFPGCGCADEQMENPYLKESEEEFDRKFDEMMRGGFPNET